MSIRNATPVTIFPWKLTEAEREYLELQAAMKLDELGVKPFAISKYLNWLVFGDTKGLKKGVNDV